jgi:uncharacterized membrane protein YdjX (TVP38/TMEM64 family)
MTGNLTRLITAGLWLVFIAVAWGWSRAAGLGIGDLLRTAHAFLAHHPAAPLVFVAAYTLRPLLLFPALWLTLLAGSVFGLWLGMLYTIIGQNLSAALAYWLGRWLELDLEDGGLLARWQHTLREQGFTTVLILRVVYSPFDLVSIACGVMAVPWWPYAAGTLVGTLPSIATVVSVGASIDTHVLLNQPEQLSLFDLLDGRQLLISGVLFAASLLLAFVLHRYSRATLAGTGHPEAN